ncbi:hypothetical protein RF55_18531, partial [Lasius niger]
MVDENPSIQQLRQQLLQQQQQLQQQQLQQQQLQLQYLLQQQQQQPQNKNGICLLVIGKDRAVKADDLANHMDAVLGERGVVIGRPSKCAELRIRGINVSVSPNEVVEEIVKSRVRFDSVVHQGLIEVTAASVVVPPNTEWTSARLNLNAHSARTWDERMGMFWVEKDVSPTRVLNIYLRKSEERMLRRRGGMGLRIGLDPFTYLLLNLGNITLPQQGVLRDPAAGVEGITVPGAPTSSSYKGLTGVSTTGTPEERATAERSCVAPEENPDPEQTLVEKILHNVTVGYESALDALDAKTSHTGGMDMEVVQEEQTLKKRKADASPVVDDSSGNEVVAPHVLRRTRRNRIVDLIPVGNTIDLTRDSATNLGNTDLADADTDTPGPSGRGKKGTNRFRRKKTIKDIDCNSDLDDVTYDELLGMGVNDVGVIGLKCMDVLHEMRNLCQGQLNGKMKSKIKTTQEVINALIARALPSGDPMLLETKIQEATANLEATKEELVKWKTENGMLRNENKNLRNEITVIKTEMKKIEEVRIENEDLRRQMREINKDLQNLRKNDPRKEEVLKGGSKGVRKPNVQDRLTLQGDGFLVAGLLRMPASESSVVGMVEVVNKKEISGHTSEMVKNLKEIRRRKDSSRDACLATAMDWEAVMPVSRRCSTYSVEGLGAHTRKEPCT